ncbi:MAG: DUF1844 domain-containing protein [Candidatus Coatesbacteria bacterium]|nr:DUF1844 domain-containing protein [Candidatus Coatesbacteria bacterium]
MVDSKADQEKEVYTQTFLGLVQSMAAAGMAQLGKIANPITGEVERNLDQAQYSIAMLEMLKKKTEGNLDKDERTILDTVLTNLRMNFVEEAKKDKKAQAEKEAEKAKDESSE